MNHHRTISVLGTLALMFAVHAAPALASGEEVHASCSLGGPLGLNIICTYGGTGTDIETESGGDGAFVQINLPSGGCTEGSTTQCDEDSCPEAGGDADCNVVNACMGYAGGGDVSVVMYNWESLEIVGDPTADTVSCANLCGNGTVEGDEECDAGNENPTDGCGNPGDEDACQFQGGGSCTQTCGDGFVMSPEECDDDDTDDDDGCSSTCEIEEGWLCTGAPSICGEATAYVQTCGDGIVDAPEECDDGDTVNGDGCDMSCAIETDNVCQEAPSLCVDGQVYDPTCGDGIVDAPEACDDGNASSGDGCSGSCLMEDGYECMGAPSTCEIVTESGETHLFKQILIGLAPLIVLACFFIGARRRNKPHL